MEFSDEENPTGQSSKIRSQPKLQNQNTENGPYNDYKQIKIIEDKNKDGRKQLLPKENKKRNGYQERYLKTARVYIFAIPPGKCRNFRGTAGEGRGRGEGDGGGGENNETKSKHSESKVERDRDRIREDTKRKASGVFGGRANSLIGATVPPGCRLPQNKDTPSRRL
ncbi:hypothetical protein M0802_007946 [Mischocyttarus mexicanus]|nr:hypothetical protein M0802_007946 [Mischocyttarus mexicanus]